MTAQAWPLALSCCGSQGLEPQVFEGYARAGISAMEISLDVRRYAALNLDNSARYAREYGVRLWSIHLPFNYEFYNIASTDESTRAACLLEFCRLLDKASRAGIGIAVVHPSSEPISDEERPYAMDCALKSLRSLAQAADGLGMTIAVENLPRTCLGRNSDEMLTLLSADKRLKSCFDTNHLLSQPADEYLTAVGSHICTTHVSDYDFVNERHTLPGEGKVNWPAMVAKLKEIGYAGPFLYELSLDSSANIQRDKPLCYQDFADNYAALLRGENPKPLGKPLY